MLVPFIKGRALDVSKAAAKQLGFLSAGLAKVKIEILSYPKTKKLICDKE